MYGKCLVLALLLSDTTVLRAQTLVAGRVTGNFNQSWKFELGDQIGAQTTGYNDALWSSVGLPN